MLLALQAESKLYSRSVVYDATDEVVDHDLGDDRHQQPTSDTFRQVL